jgi:hypothetical protein
MSTPTTDDPLAQQFVLFDLHSVEQAAPAALLPQLDDIPTTSTRGKASKRSQATTPRQAPAKTTRRAQEPQRLDIPLAPDVPDLSPLLLAAVRAALFQTLYQEALSAFQALSSAEHELLDAATVLAVEPARLGAAAQLLLDTPTLKAAVSLLALGASFHPQDKVEAATLDTPIA